MKAHYDPVSDILYLRLNSGEIEESNEIHEGVLADFDSDGNIVALEIWDASERMDSPDHFEFRVLSKEAVPA